MTSPSGHTRFANAAALNISAACVLSVCLVFGLLPLGMWGVAVAAEKSPQADGTPIVVITASSISGEPSNSSPQTAPEQSNTANVSADPLGSADTSADALAPKTSTVPESPAPSETLPSKPSGSTDSSNPLLGTPDAPANALVWAVGLDDSAAVTVALHPDGTLSVQGVGKTVVFNEVEQVDGTKTITTPWLAEGYATHIKRVEFASTVEPVSLAYWFDGCKNLTEVVTLPTSAEDPTKASPPSASVSAESASASNALETSVLPAAAKNLTATFRNCESLAEAPALPEQAENLTSTFEGCTKLTLAPQLPASTRTMTATFKGCSTLIAAPELPQGIDSLASTFEGCTQLTEAPVIPASVQHLTATFKNCTTLTTAPVIPEGAITLASTFEGCAQLINAPAIPASVEDMSSAFSGCVALQAVPQIEGSPAIMDEAFFDCPSLATIPETFTFAAANLACFGFSSNPQQLVTTTYAGTNAAVIAYDWTSDGRVLADATGAPLPLDPESSGNSADAEGTPGNEGPLDSNPFTKPSNDVNAEDAPAPRDPTDPAQAQVSITVPSSVSMTLGLEGPNSATIPVSIANSSQVPVKVVGTRLKRADVDHPGGAWSLVQPASGFHFTDDARFTPTGLEAVLETPVILPANSDAINLSWQGTFTDYGMKSLIKAATATETPFTYGTLIWHVEPAL